MKPESDFDLCKCPSSPFFFQSKTFAIFCSFSSWIFHGEQGSFSKVRQFSAETLKDTNENLRRKNIRPYAKGLGGPCAHGRYFIF